MLIELVARKPIVIGEHRLNRGDVLTDEVAALLPPGRKNVLRDQGWLEDRVVDESAGTIAALEARVADLEAQLRTHRHAGRPPKEN